MALYKREGIWWIDVRHEGARIRRSARTSVKADAQQLHDKIKHDLWRQSKLDALPQKYWVDAVMRWIEESAHKRSLVTDKFHLRWLDTYLHDYALSDITKDVIEDIALAKENTNVSLVTVNRMLELIRAILRRAKNEWEWLDNVPHIRMRKVEDRRMRWLTRKEADRLLNALPPHLADIAAFTLATGLRMSNVTGLTWENIDLVRRHALVHPDQSKTKKAIPVPLNDQAIALIQKQRGKHVTHVFTYRDRPVKRCNNQAWKKALQRANIENFRWHDLRHTWASWHVQNGTSLHELQQLGGWSTYEMVLRYAHLSSQHLHEAANRIQDTFWSQPQLRVIEGGR